MSAGRTSSVQGLLIHGQPFKERASLCTFFTLEKGLIRCQLDRTTPEPYREVELKISRRDRYLRSSGFRYIKPLIIQENAARLQAMYVNELIFRLLPLEIADEALYGSYLSTLHHLQHQTKVTQALRFIEAQLLVTLGQGLDYRCEPDGRPIDGHARYRFQALQGFQRDPQGRYHGEQILAVADQSYRVAGSQALARECQGQQLSMLLGDRPLNSRKWFVFSASQTGDVT